MTEATAAAPKAPEPKAEKPQTEAKAKTKKVTSPVDLRVVTKNFVVFRLPANKPTMLFEEHVLEAQRCAAEEGVELKVG